MHFCTYLTTGLMALVGTSLARPTHVDPGNRFDLILTEDNTVNGTAVGPHFHPPEVQAAGAQSLPLSFVNNYSGGALNAYVTGKDSSNRVVILKPDGTFYYPSSGGSKVPVLITANLAIPMGGKGSTTNITVPNYITSARIWFAEGQLKFYMVTNVEGKDGLVEPSFTNPDDPNAGIFWGFVEFNTDANGIFANISYVDFVGMVLGMSLKKGDGSDQTVKGLLAGAQTSICNELKAQKAADNQPWDKLCMVNAAGTPLRVLSPTKYTTDHPTEFATYWAQYVDDVWARYTAAPLTINTQNAPGNVTCRVTGSQLLCNGDNRGYAKPSAKDIWGCDSGPFSIQGGDNAVHKAIVPRLCAAFVRSTLLLPGGNVQPGLDSTNYYKVSPTNHYSRIVHKYEADGKGYAFAYDDVNPHGDTDQAGTVADANPQRLTMFVGGPPA